MQVKESFNPLQHNRANRKQRIGKTDGKHLFTGLMGDLNIADKFAVLTLHLDRPEISFVTDIFDLRNSSSAQKAEELIPIQGRTVAQAK